MAVCVMASVFMWRSCPLDGCLCDGICIHVEVLSIRSGGGLVCVFVASVFMWRSCPLDGCLCDGICIHVEVLSIRWLFV